MTDSSRSDYASFEPRPFAAQFIADRTRIPQPSLGARDELRFGMKNPTDSPFATKVAIASILSNTETGDSKSTKSPPSTSAPPRKRKPVKLKPTYPLDVDQIRELKQLALCDSPKLLVWQLLAQLGSRFTLLSRFAESWSEIEPKLCDAVVEHVVKQSNIAQNQVIRCLIDVLRDRQRNEYAEMLKEFLRAKQSIELALKTNRSLNAQRADVETIVDSILQEVCNELFLLIDMESELTRLQGANASTEIVDEFQSKIEISKERIAKAHETLRETEKQTTCRQPTHSVESDEPTFPESDVLDKLIDALRDENEFAKNLNDRITQELPENE